jgi:hypothetical protein
VQLGRTASFMRAVQTILHRNLVAEFSGLFSRPERQTKRAIQLGKVAKTAGKISAPFVEVLEGHTAPRTQLISAVRNFCVAVVNFQKLL